MSQSQTTAIQPCVHTLLEFANMIKWFFATFCVKINFVFCRRRFTGGRRLFLFDHWRVLCRMEAQSRPRIEADLAD